MAKLPAAEYKKRQEGNTTVFDVTAAKGAKIHHHDRDGNFLHRPWARIHGIGPQD